MGRSIPASSADATTDLGSSRPRVLLLSLRVCLRTGALIRSAFTSPSASHLSPRTCCVFHLFLVSAGCSEGGTVGFAGRCCFFLFLFEDGSCERTLGFRKFARDRCTVEDCGGGGVGSKHVCASAIQNADQITVLQFSFLYFSFDTISSLQEVLGLDCKFP